MSERPGFGVDTVSSRMCRFGTFLIRSFAAAELVLVPHLLMAPAARGQEITPTVSPKNLEVDEEEKAASLALSKAIQAKAGLFLGSSEEVIREVWDESGDKTPERLGYLTFSREQVIKRTFVNTYPGAKLMVDFLYARQGQDSKQGVVIGSYLFVFYTDDSVQLVSRDWSLLPPGVIPPINKAQELSGVNQVAKADSTTLTQLFMLVSQSRAEGEKIQPQEPFLPLSPVV